MTESMPIAGFYRDGPYSKILLPPTFCSAPGIQKSTLSVSDSEVQCQLQLLSSLQLRGVVSLHPCPLSHPPPPCAHSGVHLLFIKCWLDSIHLPGSKLLVFFSPQLSLFIAELDIHHSWDKESSVSIQSGMGKEKRMKEMHKVKQALLFWLWKDTESAQL